MQTDGTRMSRLTYDKEEKTKNVTFRTFPLTFKFFNVNVITHNETPYYPVIVSVVSQLVTTPLPVITPGGSPSRLQVMSFGILTSLGSNI